MERNINVAEILKSKSKGTKLYSTVFGQMIYIGIVYNTNGAEIWLLTENRADTLYLSDGKYREGGEVTLYPSKEMRDWSKFAWKKGDVLVSMEGSKILFDKWANEDYTKFLGKIKVLGNSHCYDTAYYTLASEEEALEFIKSVEEINNGKLNLETLRIEKAQPKFKDGDILSCDEDTYTKHTTLILHKNGCVVESLVSLIRHNDLVESREPINEVLLSRLYPAREDEKKQLFDALAKEGKVWDANKKQIVNLKPKIELKPFDKVLVRDGNDEIWEPAFFFRNRPELNVYKYQTVGGESRVYCIPYNEETAKLIGTSDDWEG